MCVRQSPVGGCVLHVCVLHVCVPCVCSFFFSEHMNVTRTVGPGCAELGIICDGKRGTEVSDSCRTAGPSSRSADKQDKTSQHDMTGRKRGAKQQQKRRQGDEDWISVT